ncbi:hypothetical protein PV396_35935 [Streptomyces sp. ME02-8801-2C]|uniref:hypothetical protein n=1 Tax=Streptomyces sp. ME02-8801-2C TaxID=3028680 RepID=UPI0029A4947E|nr:hypothetical protein [Streptomyces sp. ME02-8801-2C]MDX3457289.1 hypothetical protein [Streptomyces sp. ME02-8801-2C]
MVIVETDSDPARWLPLPLSVTKSGFAQWLDRQLDANALFHGRRLTWREKRQMKKFLAGSAAMLRDRVEADQAFVFGPMPPQAAPLIFFTKQFAGAEKHSPRHLGVLAEPDPTGFNLGDRVETVAFISPYFGEGLRCLRGWTGPGWHADALGHVRLELTNVGLVPPKNGTFHSHFYKPFSHQTGEEQPCRT